MNRRDPAPENKYRRSIYDLPVTVTVSLGQRRMAVAELLELGPESVVSLNSKIEDPVDLVVEDRVIAKGELVEDGEGGIAVKITEIQERSDG